MERYYCAGIVTYHPDMELLEKNIASIAPQVLEVLIVDNGSKNIEAIRALCTAWDNVTLLENGKNLGVAAALNRYMSWARERGYEWALTLDQDNVCESNMMEMLQGFSFNEGLGILAALNHCDRDDPLPADAPPCIEISKMITNGSLIRVKAWEELGGYDEWLFIDAVDADFCFRLKMAGYAILLVPDAVAHHEIGKMQIVYENGEKIYLYNQSPKRNYYYIRSRLYFVRKKIALGSCPKKAIWNAYRGIFTFERRKIKYEKYRPGTIFSTVMGFVVGRCARLHFQKPM